MCSVSSCQRKNAPIVYCSVDCWELHVPVVNHKQAGADEYWSPARSLTQEEIPRRKIVRPPSPPTDILKSESSPESSKDSDETDILVVISKFKQYVKDVSGFQTSATVFPVLSDLLRMLADKAIANAQQEGRKTIMDRDIPKKF
jgi:histone H3/H4